jgi:hypothetical protein
MLKKLELTLDELKKLEKKKKRDIHDDITIVVFNLDKFASNK